MKNTWMISQNSKYYLLTELYYYYIFLIKNFSMFINISKFNFNKIVIKYNLIFKNISTLQIKNSSHINKYLNYKINQKINYNEIPVLHENKTLHKFIFTKKNLKHEYKFFNIYFLFNYSLFNSNFKIHPNFKLFYVNNSSNKIILVDSTKFVLRWKESYDLIFNIFFYNFNPMIFSTNFFKKETLSLNWNYNTFDINLWKYYFPFFIFKLNNYNRKTDFFFDKLNDMQINFFFISDCMYHFKNLHYMKKKNMYTVGLLNINLDPWIISYPLISFFDSFLTQLFFFKILIFIERKSLLMKYIFFKNTWQIYRITSR